MGLLPCNIGDIAIQVPLIRMIPLKSEAKIDPKHPKKACLQGLLRTSLNLCNGFMEESDMITPYDLSCRTWKVFLRASEKLHPLLYLTTSPIHRESRPAESILESQPWSVYNPLISPSLLGGVVLRVGGGGYRHNQPHANDSNDGFKLIFFSGSSYSWLRKFDPCWWSDAFKVFDELCWLFPLRL